MKRCSHPNVAALLELSTIAVAGTSYDYLIEPFMAGGSLDNRISKGRLNRDEVLTFGAALIDAVGHIAAHNLVHRDIKPANIMFAEDHGAPVLGDFGIVRDLGKESLTPSFFASGPCTPYFAAPEQLNNEKFLIDWRTDQFAIATTLAYAHFGFHPYRGVGERDDQSVFKVASRKGPSEEFFRMAAEARLPALLTMLAPWPVGRYRTHPALTTAWASQRESK
jgi:serine/threonine protein kinase